MQPTVFLDRDGTINRDVGYVNHPDQLAHNAGATAVMVLTDHGSSQWREYPSTYVSPHHVCSNLYEAVQWIVNRSK